MSTSDNGTQLLGQDTGSFPLVVRPGSTVPNDGEDHLRRCKTHCAGTSDMVNADGQRALCAYVVWDGEECRFASECLLADVLGSSGISVHLLGDSTMSQIFEALLIELHESDL